MAIGTQIKIDGIKELRRAVRNAVDKDLPKRMSQANKKIGEQIIGKWLTPPPRPETVGTGRAAKIRPSATRFDVVLRVGGVHRTRMNTPVPTKSKNRFALAPWGKPKQIFMQGPRPHILGSALDHREEIIDMYFEGIKLAVDPAFYSVKP